MGALGVNGPARRIKVAHGEIFRTGPEQVAIAGHLKRVSFMNCPRAHKTPSRRPRFCPAPGPFLCHSGFWRGSKVLFDYLAGACEQERRNSEPEGLGGPLARWTMLKPSGRKISPASDWQHFTVNPSQLAASRFSQRIHLSDTPFPYPPGLRSGNGSQTKSGHLQSLR